jgi:hypothetical protein
MPLTLLVLSAVLLAASGAPGLLLGGMIFVTLARDACSLRVVSPRRRSEPTP